jgi:hypothetical protein
VNMVLDAPAVTPAALRAWAAPAVDGFLRLAAFWGWTGEQRVQALGHSVSRQTISDWRSRPPESISADQLLRVSYLLAIYEGLTRFFARDAEAVRLWMRRRNVEEPFNGRTPEEYVLGGGIPALHLARGYVDALTGGPPSRAFTADALPAPTRDLPLPADAASW